MRYFLAVQVCLIAVFCKYSSVVEHQFVALKAMGSKPIIYLFYFVLKAILYFMEKWLRGLRRKLAKFLYLK